jgi:hypothetical protein
MKTRIESNQGLMKDEGRDSEASWRCNERLPYVLLEQHFCTNLES